MSPASSGLFLSPEVLVGLRDDDRRADGGYDDIRRATAVAIAAATNAAPAAIHAAFIVVRFYGSDSYDGAIRKPEGECTARDSGFRGGLVRRARGCPSPGRSSLPPE